MATRFQSRLVGTIILVAAGVIVLPDLLDGEKKHYKEELAAIPIKPDVNTEIESFEILEPVEVQTALPDSPVQADSSKENIKDEVAVTVVDIVENNQYQISMDYSAHG